MKRLLCCFLFASSVPLALRAEEAWYLISEMELQSIERYKATSEQEKQSLLLQASRLRKTAEELKNNSTALNQQLTQAREDQRKSEALYEQYEAALLKLLSLKNGEIYSLKTDLSAERLKRTESENQRDIAWGMIAVFFVAAVILGILKIRRNFRPI
jgi:hypothetical protein